MTRCAPPAIPFLRIEYADTNDDPIDHQPVVPGIITDNEYWAIVAHCPDGRTRWRRIRLECVRVLNTNQGENRND
jgi:hypothetical protein